jgi:DNA-binding NtrC family response regulator
MTGTSSHPPKARAQVLLVDDDPRFLVTLEAVLSTSFDVTSCSSAADALGMDLARFHVVCADYDMPGANGLELLDKVTRRYPAVCCLLMTGADDFFDEVKHAARRPPVIFKPLDPDRMLHTVGHLASIAAMKRSAAALVDASGQPSPPPRGDAPSPRGDEVAPPPSAGARRARRAS